MKVISMTKKLISALVFIPVISVCHTTDTENSHAHNKFDRGSIECLKMIAGGSAESSPIIEEQSERIIISDKVRRNLDTYLALHMRWKFKSSKYRQE